jgi:GDPmannose 4,6-dehydratase
MKRAFITGITGQDGSYLAEFLLEKGYEVHGLIRRASTFNTARIDHIFQDPHEINPQLFLHYGDLIDGVGLTTLIREIKPDEVYNLGAQSHVQVSFSMPQYTGQVDAVGAVGLLEAIRSAEVNTRFYQASTSELFGSTPPPQNEESFFKPRSPYAAAKLMAYWCTVNYREGYGMHASNGILFNHESPRRGSNFVTNKVVKGAVEIKLGLATTLEMGNMDSFRDWGHSKDYVKAMHLILQHDKADDFVVATGETRSVREMCNYVFSQLGLNYADHVVQNPKYLRPEELQYLRGDSTKIRTTLDWKPEYTFNMLMDEMIEFWMKIYQEQSPTL